MLGKLRKSSNLSCDNQFAIVVEVFENMLAAMEGLDKKDDALRDVCWNLAAAQQKANAAMTIMLAKISALEDQVAQLKSDKDALAQRIDDRTMELNSRIEGVRGTHGYR